MKNIRLLIIGSSFVIIAWLAASYLSDTQSDKAASAPVTEEAEKADVALTE